jgi:hypothetical protein
VPADEAPRAAALRAIPGAQRAHALATLPDDALVTTREAAALLGFRTPSAVRKAHMEGRLRSAGRRGACGAHVWLVRELRRFMRGLPPAD